MAGQEPLSEINFYILNSFWNSLDKKKKACFFPLEQYLRAPIWILANLKLTSVSVRWISATSLI